MKLLFIFFGFLTVQIFKDARASNILGLFLTNSPSNIIVHMAIIRALVERGHNVTVITSLPINDPNPGYRHIHLKNLGSTQEEVNRIVNEAKETPSFLRVLKLFSILRKIVYQYSEFVLDPDFVRFIEEGNHFDLMHLGYASNDLQLGVAAHFRCPIVLSYVNQPFGYISRMIGNPTHPEFVPFSPFMDPKPMKFQGKVESFIFSIVERLVTTGISFFSERIYDKSFPSDKYPSLAEMKRNISLILVNHHFSEGPVRPLVPGLVEIGGIQIKDKPNPLPKDIKQFLENSQKGAILFSLGSNVQQHHLGFKASDTIYKVLSSLPYKVIWKFDSDKVPGNASNILFKKWLPQDDILGHKNLKVFVTHAGKGSISESEYHAIPMVAIPVMGDQFKNAEIMQSKGHGLMLKYQTITEDTFRKTILEVIENDKYKKSVENFSKLYRDRPLSPRDTAIYWIEYILRYKGAPHMQSPLKDYNIFEENSLDVILFLIVVIYVIIKIVKIYIWIAFAIMRVLENNFKPHRKLD